MDKKIRSEIKKSFVVKRCPEHTQIFVLAVHAVRNVLTPIEYKNGKPLTACAYDVKQGKYYVDCVDYLDLGIIPISFSIRVVRISHWECKVPMTDLVIKKYLTKEQKEKLQAFQDKLKDCNFEYLQLTTCY